MSKRIGNTLDGNERLYFGLFYDLGHFESAIAYKMNDSVSFVIKRKERPDTLITLAQKTAKKIQDYIENAEEPQRFRTDSELLRFIRISELIPRNGNLVNITKVDNSTITGRILFVNDTVLGIWTNADKYNWSQVEQKVAALHYSQINSIEYTDIPLWPMAIKTALGAGFGTLGYYTIGSARSASSLTDFIPAIAVGGLSGALYHYSQYPDLSIRGNRNFFSEQKNDLHENAIFLDLHTPPELQSISTSDIATSIEMPSQIKNPAAGDKFHVLFGVTNTLSNVIKATTIPLQSTAEPKSQENNSLEYLGYHIDVGYTWGNRFGIGMGIIPGKLKTDQAKDGDYYLVKTNTAILYGTYVLMGPGAGKATGFEISASLGALISQASEDGQIIFTAFDGDVSSQKPSLQFSSSKVISGIMGRLNASYYFTSFLSSFVGVEQHFAPSFVTEAHVMEIYQYGRQYFKSYSSYSHNLSNLFVRAGAQFHF